ncbi:flagellar biosynthesis protein FlhA [Engelhardtia mirabilis]|uniref:Flagellar biosynthesis protein FlhA n=1 Tax=Engelhardtia mirabilis TaxID=2528011 RepID=A0A518BSQ7_9BACT|nr:Flagellar biosynthesis protein FlhA [Planctomycetes bacterium Pla133]QDV04329.1 Flagellar biosynthesis protein FlhA [Planctomycetes bacterium Pla86]
MSELAENAAASGEAPTSFGAGILKRADLLVGGGVLALMMTLVMPLPPWVLDSLLTFNIAFSLLMLLVTINVRDAAELSAFPTILLFGTLMRLGLNVASTRLILSGGDAGSVISAFGAYVVRDNIVVGLIVFLILVIIQFVVITKGAGRISEVSARFVLDAMPGKQMAIDADLNAGLIGADEARARRQAIAGEAEFYGAMDGASKFVRGDAVAGLIITSLNLVVGIAVGAAGGLDFGEAAERYSRLTIGDGLVSQIPALFVSTAAAVLSTRASGRQSLSQNLIAQIGGRPRATATVAVMIFALAWVPGMPRLPFMLLASLMLIGWQFTRGADGPRALLERAGVLEDDGPASKPADEVDPDDAAKQAEEQEILELLSVDRISLEIGYRLIPLVQDKQGTGILDHVANLRKRIAGTQGLVLPPVRVKDNVRLEPGAYRIVIGGDEVARGVIEAGSYLAMDGGQTTGKVKGKETIDPAFGLPAWWVSASDRDEAEILGYTVIDSTSVLVTHLSEVLRAHLGDILSRDDVKDLVENVKRVAPAVVEEVVPDRVGYGLLQQVLRNLLREGAPIRNMPAILEALADQSERTKDVDALTEGVRQRLGRSLCEQHADADGILHAVTLDPDVEARIAHAVGSGGPAENEAQSAPIGPAWLRELVERVEGSMSEASRGGREVVLLVRSNVRRFVSELVRASLPKVAVLSYGEVTAAGSIETQKIVRMDDDPS